MAELPCFYFQSTIFNFMPKNLSEEHGVWTLVLNSLIGKVVQPSLRKDTFLTNQEQNSFFPRSAQIRDYRVLLEFWKEFIKIISWFWLAHCVIWHIWVCYCEWQSDKGTSIWVVIHEHFCSTGNMSSSSATQSLNKITEWCCQWQHQHRAVRC